MIPSVIQIEKFVSARVGYCDERLDHHTRGYQMRSKVRASAVDLYARYRVPMRAVFIRLALSAALTSPALAQSATPAARLGVAPRSAPIDAPTKKAPIDLQFRSVEQIGHWINQYRNKPEPQRLPQLFRGMAELNMFADQDNSGLYLGFVGGVLSANPEIANSLVAKMFPLPPEYHAPLIKAIAYSGLPEWREMLRTNAERMPGRVVLVDRFMTGTMQSFEALKLDAGPVPLDVLWGNYFATGSYEPILRIVSVLAWSKDLNDVERLTIGSMAKWTLATNASNDVQILRLLKSAMTTEPTSTQKILTEVIAAAETGETSKIRKEALMAIEQLKLKGPEKTRTTAWWGQAGQMALSFGCIAASVLGAPATIGIPCVIGGAASTAVLKMMTPQ